MFRVAAVKSRGGALEYADDSLKKDREIVLEAVQNDGSGPEYVDDVLGFLNRLIFCRVL